MNAITSWAASVCIVAVICAIYDMLVPEGNTSKMLNFVLGMFLIVAILIPFVNIVKSEPLNFKNIEFNSEEFTLSEENNNLTLAVGKSTVEKIISDSLKEKDIIYKKIVVDMDSSNGNSIDIIRAKIYVESDYRNQIIDIQRIVQEKTGITPDVVVG